MERVLVDSSVWIDFLRLGKSREATHLDELLATDEICTTWIVRVEVLSGARSEPEHMTLENRLAGVPILDLQEGFWNELARARYKLSRAGFQASIPDVSIGIIARYYRCPLLTLDRPLMQIAKLLPVKLYETR